MAKRFLFASKGKLLMLHPCCLLRLRMRYLGRDKGACRSAVTSTHCREGRGGSPYQSLLRAYAPVAIGRTLHLTLGALAVVCRNVSAEKAPHFQHHQMPPLVMIK